MLTGSKVYMAHIDMLSCTNFRVTFSSRSWGNEESHHVRRACQLVPVKMIEWGKKSRIRLLSWLRREERRGEEASPKTGEERASLSDWLLYGTAAKTHSQLSVLQLGENLGRSERADLRGFGFYGRKGSSALIMPHLKMPRHTLAQFRVVPLCVRSTNSTHANSSSATLITDYIPCSARIVQRRQIRMVHLEKHNLLKHSQMRSGC